MSQSEEVLAVQLDDALIHYKREYVFHPTRRWRFDFAIPSNLIAVEVEGGLTGAPLHCQACGATVMIRTKAGKSIVVRQSGRHNVGAGYQSDLEKYQEAVLLGWRVVRVSTADVKSGRAIDLVKRLLQNVR